LTYYTFLGGISYRKSSHAESNSYFYEIYGYLLVLICLILERKSQVWLRRKFGFVGSIYDQYKGKIVLEGYAPEPEDKLLKPKDSVIKEEDEEDFDRTDNFSKLKEALIDKEERKEYENMEDDSRYQTDEGLIKSKSMSKCYQSLSYIHYYRLQLAKT
jgi:hypothetical protein